MIDQHLANHRVALMQKAATALTKNGFTVISLTAVDQLTTTVQGLIAPGATLAHGGSTTLQQTGLIAQLEAAGHPVMKPGPSATPEEVVALRRNMLLADVYFGSPNAVTLDGKLMFIDKIGNRTGGMTFGPGHIIAVAGINKIVHDEPAGWQRIKLHACPPNGRRLDTQTPCAITGICTECASPRRMCGVRLVLERKPAYTPYTVILIPEERGY